MLFDPKYEEQLEVLEERLRHAHAFTPDLMSDVIAKACTRVAAHGATYMAGATSMARVNQLIEAGAWTDAALAMVELELPYWTVRRLTYEDAKWYCSISRQPRLPVPLDDTANASHEVLPVAILSALVEAHRRMGATRAESIRKARKPSRHQVMRSVATISADLIPVTSRKIA